MTGTILPALSWQSSPNRDTRRGPVSLVVVHRWGDRVTTAAGEKVAYLGTVNYFTEASSQVSAHVVFPGSAVPGQATQMVGWTDYAWAEAAYNPEAVEVESADEIWVGTDYAGMAVLARIVAFLLATGGGLHLPFDGHQLPDVWSTSRGFCRHADLGAAGGGHTQCPTTNLTQWKHFCGLVQAEYKRSGFRPVWGFAGPPAV